MKKIQTAIIGCCNIAQRAHLPGYEAAGDLCDVRYFVDVNRDNAEELRNSYGSGEVVTDYHDILKDSELDCVSVCTPNFLHAPISIDCLRAGKHVLCEKPASIDASHALEMQKAAHETGKILNIGVCMRYDSAVSKVHELIQAGELGEVYHIYCSFRAHRAIPGLGGPFTTKSRSGGGALIDWGIHYLDLISYCMAEPNIRAVSAKTYNKLGNPISDYVYKEMWAGPSRPDGVCDVEDFVTALIRTDGPTISVNGAWAQNIGEDARFIEFLGTKGGIKLQYMGGFTLFSTLHGMLTETKFDFNSENMYNAEIRDFLESVSTGVKNRAYIDNAIRTSRLMDMIYQSSDLDREVIAEKSES